MTVCEVAASLSVLAAGCVFVPGTAGAESYQPPQLAFVAHSDDSIVATITNSSNGLPKTRGVASLAAPVGEFN